MLRAFFITYQKMSTLHPPVRPRGSVCLPCSGATHVGAFQQGSHFGGTWFSFPACFLYLSAPAFLWLYSRFMFAFWVLVWKLSRSNLRYRMEGHSSCCYKTRNLECSESCLQSLRFQERMLWVSPVNCLKNKTVHLWSIKSHFACPVKLTSV
jgi:hypothetical protein